MLHEPTAQRDHTTGPAPLTASAQALSRRRLLLKGLGKGGAVVAAAAPLATFAAPTTLVTTTNRVCTVSGAMSGTHSFAPGVGLITCTGHAPSYYLNGTGGAATPQNWPASYNASLTLQALLGPSAPSGTVLAALQASLTNDLAYWIAAAFNAAAGSSTYPYSLAEVQAAYAAVTAGTTTKDYVGFFKQFLS